MPAAPTARRRVEMILVPIVAAFCMASIIAAIVLDRDRGNCPSPTWNNHLTLSLSGNAVSSSEAAAITACFGSDCVPSPPAFANSSSGSSPNLVEQKDGTWLLTVGYQPSSSIGFRVYDQNGRVLAAQSTKVNWTRVTGNERCGGRMADVSMSLEMP